MEAFMVNEQTEYYRVDTDKGGHFIKCYKPSYAAVRQKETGWKIEMIKSRGVDKRRGKEYKRAKKG